MMTDIHFKPEDIDRLGQALLTLTKEVWVLRDRQRILEAMLEQAGILDPSALETFEPDAALADTLATERRALIERVLAALGSEPAEQNL
jgi:hypothetical protein